MIEWIAAGAAGALAAGLAARLWLVRKAAREVARGLRARKDMETNTLVDISSRDKAMRELAVEINRELGQLREKRRQYQQGDLELKEAVTNISHDLRTPLTAVRGYLELLAHEDDPALMHQYLGLIAGRVEAMSRLTEELFRYSVVTAEPLGLAPLDLARALEESLVSFYGALQSQGITPEITLPSAPVPRLLDSGALSRVFSNILSNALKYSAGDLAITLTPQGRAIFENAAPG